MVWEKQNTISAAENKCNVSFCCLELLPFLSHSRPQTDFPQTGTPSMELLNAPGTSCLCTAIGHQISNSNKDQRQRGREISTPNSLTKITWSACPTHVPLTEARPYFHFGTMFYILCQHITGSPWKGENQQVKFPCLPLPVTPPPRPHLCLSPLPPPFLSVWASSHTWKRTPGGTLQPSLSSSLIPLVSASPKRWWTQRKVLWPWKQDSLRDGSGSTAWELRDSGLENQLVVPRGKEGIAQEFGMDMYTLLCLEWVATKDRLYVMCQLGWEGSLGENGYMYMYGWVPSPETIMTQFSNWLYPNTKAKIRRKKKRK